MMWPGYFETDDLEVRAFEHACTVNLILDSVETGDQMLEVELGGPEAARNLARKLLDLADNMEGRLIRTELEGRLKGQAGGEGA